MTVTRLRCNSGADECLRPGRQRGTDSTELTQMSLNHSSRILGSPNIQPPATFWLLQTFSLSSSSSDFASVEYD